MRRSMASLARYSNYKPKRFKRRLNERPFQPNVGLRHTLNTYKEEEGLPNFKNLDVDCLEDEPECDDEILHASKAYDKFCDEEQIKQKNVLYKIIKRKYFKVRPEINLLTVAAKEQLRYLHDVDPHTWTTEKLANSFPISVQGVKKLLKSNYHPETDYEIGKHDQSVLNNWKRLKAGKGPIATTVDKKYLSDDLRFERLDGDDNLPMPTEEWKRKQLLRTCNQTETRGNFSPGEFENIVKEYYDLSQMNNSNTQNDIWPSDEDNSNHEYAWQISTQNSSKKSLKPISFKEFKEQMRQKLSNSSINHPQMQEKVSVWLDRNESPSIRPHNPSKEINSEEQNKKCDNIRDFFEGKVQKFKEPSSLNIKWDIHRDVKNPKGKEAYIYERESGYQRPYGRYDVTAKIKIPEKLKRHENVYQKGNCYYDENGDLLYSIP